MTTRLQAVETMSVPEKILFVEDLWDSIAESTKSVGIPDWQKQELARRKKRYLQNPSSALPWGEVKKSILHSDE